MVAVKTENTYTGNGAKVNTLLERHCMLTIKSVLLRIGALVQYVLLFLSFTAKIMLNVKDLQKVYKKDGAGNTYRTQQTIYKGEIFDYPVGLADPCYILENIHTMKARKTDVWCITYPKSGKENTEMF